MKLLSDKPLLQKQQAGINMVDLMMWLVIAALLLAAAIQGIGYYQKAAYLYQMKSDLSGVGSLATGKAAQNKGIIDTVSVQESVADGNWSANVTPTVEGEDTPYIRATHPGVTDVDVLYLFDHCGTNYKIGVNVVPKGGNPVLASCGISATPVGGGTPSPTDLDGDGIPNESDPTPNGESGSGTPTAGDLDGDGIPNADDPTPNGESGSTPAAEYTLAAWGQNNYGQFGNGTTVSNYTSSVVSGRSFSQIDTGHSYACGISESKAYCWGNNNAGQLGIGTTDNFMAVPTAVDVSGVLAGKTVTDISAGTQHTCVIADDAAYCWGYNGYGQVAGFTDEINPVYTVRSPVLVNNGAIAGKTLKNIDAEGARTCTLDQGSAAYCWGDTQALGDGNPRTGTTSAPVAVAGNLVFVGKLTGFHGHACGISGGDAYCWGSNDYGRLGNNTADRSFTAAPSKVIGLPAGKVTAISAGDSHTCAIAESKAYCWGTNWGGQVGDGTSTDRYAAVPVDTSGVINGVALTSVSSFMDLTCATGGSGVYCWGEGAGGDGNEWGDFYSPIAVQGEITGKSIKGLSLGSYFTTLLVQ